MSKPKLIGVTGGIGSGKSTVCKIFEILGAKVYYADDQAKELMHSNAELKQRIIEIFGQDAYIDGVLNRKEIASQAFSDPQKLTFLNEAVHPAVREDFEAWVSKNDSQSILMKEAALLFETGSYKELDATVLVVADEDVRVKRILKRDAHRTESDIRKIIREQLSDKEKQPLADYIIDNGGTVSVIEQVNQLFEQLANRRKE